MTLLAKCDDAIGCISPPDFLNKVTVFDSTGKNFVLGITLVNAFLRLLFIVAGIYALYNFIMAGFDFMNSGGDPKKLSSAWGKIWQTMLGLLIIVCSFLFAALIGMLMFGDASYLLKMNIF